MTIRLNRLLVLILTSLPAPWCDIGQAAGDEASRIERLHPLEPREAVETFTVLHGFHMDLIAHEPLVRDPVAIAYDADGAMYAVEMTAYPHPERITDQALGRVRLLSDNDGDGLFDESIIFADRLSTPTSVICWKGGVFVIAPPDIWYLKDTDGDRRADLRQKIYAGFGINNAETLANSLQWGIDNRIYGATSHSGGNIRSAKHDSVAATSINGRDFCFDPATEVFEPLTWANSRWGNAFNDGYQRFVCQNTGPARHVTLPLRYLERNRYLRVEAVYESLAREGGTEPVYRTSPPEPWRVVRARRRQALGKPANPGEINAAGFFTASCGITIYRGHAYPAQFHGNLFVGDAAGNLVHRRTLTDRSVTFQSQRADSAAEFIASSDNFFRPVSAVNAPDGTLHIVDMYREVVEGPSWVPEDLKQKGLVDVHGGSDRGRIYRLTPPGFQVPSPPRLSQATVTELVEHLQNQSSWWRETAQRLLVERQEPGAIVPLRGALRDAAPVAGRLHALWTLAGLAALRDEDLIVALADESSMIRAHAVRAAESRLNRSSRVLASVLALHKDPAPRVRFQVAFTLGQVDDPRAIRYLAEIAAMDVGDRWIRTAVFSSVANTADQLLETLLQKTTLVQRKEGAELLTEVASLVGARKQPAEIERSLTTVNTVLALDLPVLQIGLVVALLQDHRDPLSPTAERIVKRLLPFARRLATDEGSAAVQRADAIRLAGLAIDAATIELLKPLLDTRQPREVQLAAVRALSTASGDDVAELLIEKWTSVTPAVRAETVEALASKPDWVDSLLAAVKAKRIPAGEIGAARRATLMKHADASIRELAVQLLADEALGERKDVIASYQPALTLGGDAERGKAVFLRECIACHRFGDKGHDIGPNLSDYGRKRLASAALMTQILDPNREVSSDFVNYSLLHVDGRILSGMIATQTPASITLKRDQNITATVLRKDIETITSSGKSLMPEGLEKKLSLQEMADLLEFLSAVNQRI